MGGANLFVGQRYDAVSQLWPPTRYYSWRIEEPAFAGSTLR
jgi:hypothetical protein